jgi:hypothetical protein
MPVVHAFRTAMHTAMVATLVTVSAATAEVSLTGVPQANPKVVGLSVPTALSPELRQFIVAQGSIQLENGTDAFPFYGYNGDGPMVPAPGDVQAPGHNTVDYPSTVEDISGALGRGGYEGIQNDADGNIWIVEDVGGASGTVNVNARQPNSFIYRFLPKDPTNLKAGKLQALQVIFLASGQLIVFHAGQADADILSQDVHLATR